MSVSCSWILLMPQPPQLLRCRWLVCLCLFHMTKRRLLTFFTLKADADDLRDSMMKELQSHEASTASLNTMTAGSPFATWGFKLVTFNLQRKTTSWLCHWGESGFTQSHNFKSWHHVETRDVCVSQELFQQTKYRWEKSGKESHFILLVSSLLSYIIVNLNPMSEVENVYM